MEHVTLKEIFALIEECLYIDPDFPPTEEQILANLQAIATAADMEQDKADTIGACIRDAMGRIDAIKEEERRLATKRKSIENRLENLKGYFQNIFTENGVKKIAGKKYTLSVRSTPSVVIDDINALPKQYVKVVTEYNPDKMGIKAAFKAGEQITGAHIENNLSFQVR